MKDRVMTVNDVARYLRMQSATIYRHAQKGKIPAFKVGSSWRFKESTIDRWIAEQERLYGRKAYSC